MTGDPVAGTGGLFGLVTNRHGIDGRRSDGMRLAEGGAARLGVSVPPYDSFNLGAGVGDDPEAVRTNRSALARAVGLAPGNLIWMSQVHGTGIAEVKGPLPDPLPATDGMVSAAEGIGLAVLVADCVPVLAADRLAGVIGAVHAGRLGASAGIVPALLERMAALGATPRRMEVLVGPAICGKCYEVPADMRDDVEGRLPGSASVTAQGTAGLDLRAGLLRQLGEHGVRTVEIDWRCTREDPDLYSHRRAAPSGRFAAVVRQ